MKLSVILIMCNEAAHIRDCLASVSFADEIIVLDSGSNDDSVAIAQSMGARVVQTDWPGFGAQKNRALDLANAEWVLSIDADERVSSELAAEIRALMQQSAQAASTHTDTAPWAYTLPRLSTFMGTTIRHSGWWPDPVLRLVKRGHARFTDVQVHESLQLQPAAPHRVAPLKGLLLHHSYVNFEQVLDKVNAYSSAGAKDLLRRGRKGSFAQALGHGVWAFVRTYLFKQGFRDGRAGFMIAAMNAQTAYYKYLKLTQLTP